MSLVVLKRGMRTHPGKGLGFMHTRPLLIFGVISPPELINLSPQAPSFKLLESKKIEGQLIVCLTLLYRRVPSPHVFLCFIQAMHQLYYYAVKEDQT